MFAPVFALLGGIPVGSRGAPIVIPGIPMLECWPRTGGGGCILGGARGAWLGGAKGQTKGMGAGGIGRANV